MRHMSGNQFGVPLVIRMATAGGACRRASKLKFTVMTSTIARIPAIAAPHYYLEHKVEG